MPGNTYLALGLMSGTSLDGVDLVLCNLTESEKKWDYQIIDAKTVAYPENLQNALENCMNLSAPKLFQLDAELGVYFGNIIKTFLQNRKPLLIASHGHTVLHAPENGYTVQIGKGSHIAEISGVDTVCDFRSNDIALGGQGAPLVPIGDELLFGKYDACLNLGGIANISFRNEKQRVAYDICFCNMVINYLAKQVGLDMDKNGGLAQKGLIDHELLKKLEDTFPQNSSGPKSLGKESFVKHILPLLGSESIENQLRTVSEYIANAISFHIPEGSCLVTGGGAWNTFLIDLIQKKTLSKLIIPEKNIVEFKEGLIFALLGLLRRLEQPNSLSSVTGASKNTIGGAIYKVSP